MASLIRLPFRQKGIRFLVREIERLEAVEDIPDGLPNFEAEPDIGQECASIPENTTYQTRNDPLVAFATVVLLGVRVFKRFVLHRILPSSPMAGLPTGCASSKGKVSS